MGKPSPPKAPDYTPFIAASQAAAASDAEAARIQTDFAREQLAKQGTYADRAANLGDKYAQMATDAAAFGKLQYNDIKPYLQKYMEEQSGFQDQATQNAVMQNKAAALSNLQAQETYDRYKSTYQPLEDRYSREAFEYASPARQEQDAAAARGDVAGAFQARRDATTRQLASYGINPLQGAFAGRMQALDISEAASLAAAGTMARRQTEAQGKQYETAAIEVGQKLPAQALAQAGLGLNQTQSGLGGAAIGGGGIGAANQSLYAGTMAMGSPTQYAALNPYTQLAGAYGTQGVGLFGASNSALGNVNNAISVGSGALNSGFNNQMEAYKAQAALSPWNTIGTIAGMAGKAFLPIPG